MFLLNLLLSSVSVVVVAVVVVSIAAAVAVVAVSPSISHYFDSVSAVASYLTVVTVAIVVALKNSSDFQAQAAKQSILLMGFSWWINIPILL